MFRFCSSNIQPPKCETDCRWLSWYYTKYTSVLYRGWCVSKTPTMCWLSKTKRNNYHRFNKKGENTLNMASHCCIIIAWCALIKQHPETYTYSVLMHIYNESHAWISPELFCSPNFFVSSHHKSAFSNLYSYILVQSVEI